MIVLRRSTNEVAGTAIASSRQSEVRLRTMSTCRGLSRNSQPEYTAPGAPWAQSHLTNARRPPNNLPQSSMLHPARAATATAKDILHTTYLTTLPTASNQPDPHLQLMYFTKLKTFDTLAICSGSIFRNWRAWIPVLSESWLEIFCGPYPKQKSLLDRGFYPIYILVDIIPPRVRIEWDEEDTEDAVFDAAQSARRPVSGGDLESLTSQS